MPQLIFGLIIVFVGIVFTLDSLGIADAEYYLRYWPIGLMALGAAKLWQARGGSFGAVVLLVIGTWFLVSELHMVRFNPWDLVWPMLLLFVGGSLVWRSVTTRRLSVPTSDATATLSATAILSGVSRGNASRSFRGGDLTAVMGGCEIDLRQAAIDGEAVIDVFALWGGIEIRVPEDWMVIGQVTPFMGGYDDKTRARQGSDAHRLVIRGMVIMGGVEVKN